MATMQNIIKPGPVPLGGRRPLVSAQPQAEPAALPAAVPSTTPDPDAEEKQAIEAAFAELARRLQEAAPHIDFEKEYAPLRQKQAEGAPQAGRLNPLSQFAIALGAGQEGLSAAERTRTGEQERLDKSWSEMLDIQREAIRGDIAQKMEAGKFKQALAQSETLMKLEAMRSRMKGEREHKQDVELEQTKQRGRINLQEQKDRAARQRLVERLNHVADAYKLEGDLRKEFFKQMLGVYATRLKQQDVTGEPVITGGDFMKTMDEAVDWAEDHSSIDFASPIPRPGKKADAAPVPKTNERPSGQRWREAAQK